MEVIIRPEAVPDYHRVAEINALAFYPYLEHPLTSTYLPEFNLVDALRHSGNYDPELALVAEVNGIVVGHAFFYPFRVFVSGEKIKAVSVGPIAVDPQFQSKGIGGQLMDEGHKRTRDKGFIFSFLLGHDSYYPRFGYIPNMFGECRLEVNRDTIPETKTKLEERLVLADDIESLLRMWKYWFEDVDLSLFPGTSILDWIPHTEEIMSVTVVQDGEIIGYIRYTKHNPAELKLFIAKDKPSTLVLLSYLNSKIKCTDLAMIKLPLHPESKAVKECLELPYKVRLTTWSAGMIKILDPDNRAIGVYCDEVSCGKRNPGLIIYPPCLEIA